MGELKPIRVARFKQIDVARAIKGAKSAGLRVSSVEIDPRSGKIIILSESPASPQRPNPWDQDLQP